MKTIKITQLLLLVFLSTIFLNGQPAGKKPMLDELNLTDQQKDKIENLRADHQKRMIDLRANVEKSVADLRAIERKGDYSRNDYLAAVDKITKARNELAKERANHRMDVYEQLNADQKKIFNDRPFGRRDGMRGKYHKGRGMGDCRGMGYGGNGQGMGDGRCMGL